MNSGRVRFTLLGMAVAAAVLLRLAATFVGAGPTLRAADVVAPLLIAPQQAEVQSTAPQPGPAVAPRAAADADPDPEQNDAAPAWVWGVIGGVSAGAVGLGLAYAIWLRRRGAAPR